MSVDVQKLLSPYLEQVEVILNGALTGTPFEQRVNAMCQMVVNAGGKRIRPKVLLLSAGLITNLEQNQKDRDEACTLAAGVELLHTATLIHDDVIDNSPKRRGADTLNETFGNHVAVLAGDYLFTRCFELLQKLNSLNSMALVSKTVAALVSGEINQLERKGDFSLSHEDYLKTIYCKTGALFELAASGYAAFKELPEDKIAALSAYGREVGNAFQMVDDILDYTSDTATLGKKVGLDLKDGRVTLPVIIAMRSLKGRDLDDLHEAVANHDFAAVNAAINKCNALQTCQKEALSCSERAVKNLELFPDSDFKDGLAYVAQKAVRRIS